MIVCGIVLGVPVLIRADLLDQESIPRSPQDVDSAPLILAFPGSLGLLENAADTDKNVHFWVHLLVRLHF